MIIMNNPSPEIIMSTNLIYNAKYIEEDLKYIDYYLTNISDYIYLNCQLNKSEFFLTKENFTLEGELIIPYSLYGNFKTIFNNTYSNDIDIFIEKINKLRNVYGIPLINRIIAEDFELDMIYKSEKLLRYLINIIKKEYIKYLSLNLNSDFVYKKEILLKDLIL